jgi:hypothetical protein
MKVDFQIIHSFKSRELKERLLFLLKETIDESTTTSIEIEKKPRKIEDWLIFKWIEIKYNYPSNDKYFAGFSLHIDGFSLVEGFGTNIEEFKKLTEEFGQKLQSNSDIDLVIKYNDEVMATKYQEYSKEIFNLEMELREVINFIFLDTYKEDYYNLLKDIDVTTQPLDKNNKPDENYFKAHFENELFFLNFSGYIKINELKNLKDPDLIEMIKASNFYDEMKQKLLNRGIREEKYQDFLAGIKQDLDPIEKVRNCIAHNRSIPKSDNNKMIVDYENAKDRLKQSIYDFWVNIKND